MSSSETWLHEEVSEQTRSAFPYSELRRSLYRRLGFVATSACVGLLFAATAAFLIPNRYQSTAELMPPEQQAISTTSALNALTGQMPSMAGSSLLNSKTPGATSIGILESRTVQDEIINRFDLRRVYRKKLYADTRKVLINRTHLEEDRKNGIIKIEVTDTDPHRAQEMTKAYIQDLNKLLNNVSTSSARREREFLESRIADVKQSLAESTRALSQFSSRNATFDPQKQGAATMDVAGKLEAELISAESDLSGLKAVFTDGNVQVRTANARIAQLRAQLQKISGQGQLADANDLKEGDMFPSVRKLPILGATYYDLARQVTMQETLYTTLEKQYELARVQEAKEIPGVKVLDEPDVAERKSFPPRALIMLLGAVLSALLACAWIIISTLRHRASRDLCQQEGEASSNTGKVSHSAIA